MKNQEEESTSINLVDKTEAFNMKIKALNLIAKPYITDGPQKIQSDLQRTQSSMLLNVDNGENKVKLFRAGQDTYHQSYNFCELPEIPLANKEMQRARLRLCKPNSFENIMSSQIYDEREQMSILK